MTPMNQPEQNTIRQNYTPTCKGMPYIRRQMLEAIANFSEIPSSAEKAREVAIDAVVTLKSTRNYIYM